MLVADGSGSSTAVRPLSRRHLLADSAPSGARATACTPSGGGPAGVPGDVPARPGSAPPVGAPGGAPAFLSTRPPLIAGALAVGAQSPPHSRGARRSSWA